MEESASFYASGKLYLFGEYLVLRGANSLAMPLKYGQRLMISPSTKEGIFWKSAENRRTWFQARFNNELKLVTTTDADKAKLAGQLFRLIKELKPDFDFTNTELRFDLEFDRNYGWGTSSTLISLLGQWADVDPYYLLENTIGGSGYDIAAATAESPYTYQIVSDEGLKKRLVHPVHLNESVTNHLLFIYSGRKQNSRKGIARFKEKKVTDNEIETMNTIVTEVIKCDSIEKFEYLISESNKMLSKIVKLPLLKRNAFKSYPYSVKWLGAWGGDFLLATYRDIDEARRYFIEKNMRIVYPYNEIVK